MRHALLIAASLAIVGCDAVSPYAGVGLGTNIGGVNVGTGVSVNPFRVLGALGDGGRTTAAPAPVVATPIREYRTPDGRLCRDFEARGSTGTACLGGDGQWRVVAN